MAQHPHQSQGGHGPRWPEHLRSEEQPTRLGRSTRIGLGAAGAVLAGLMVLSWSGAVPASEPDSPTPIATTR